jgi:hypothetical protein
MKTSEPVASPKDGHYGICMQISRRLTELKTREERVSSGNNLYIRPPVLQAAGRESSPGFEINSAVHGLPKVSPGPTLSRPAGGQHATVFYPFGHPTPYADGQIILDISRLLISTTVIHQS